MTPPPKVTKSQIAQLYGVTWTTFKKYVYEFMPHLKGNRRNILFPKEVKRIYEELGDPAEFTNP